MSQQQHSLTGEWHRTECAALTRQERVDCDCPEFDFYDVDPFIQAGAGEGYYFRWHGQKYLLESWSTPNACGEDIYDTVTGDPATPWAEDEEAGERFQKALEAFQERWYDAWAKHVDPALVAAKKEVLAA